MDSFESDLQKLSVSWNTTKNILEQRIISFKNEVKKLESDETGTLYAEIMVRDYKRVVGEFDDILAELSSSYNNLMVEAKVILESAKTQLEQAKVNEGEINSKLLVLESEIQTLKFEQTDMAKTFSRYAEVGLFDKELFNLHFPAAIGEERKGE